LVLNCCVPLIALFFENAPSDLEFPFFLLDGLISLQPLGAPSTYPFCERGGERFFLFPVATLPGCLAFVWLFSRAPDFFLRASRLEPVHIPIICFSVIAFMLGFLVRPFDVLS